MANHRNDNGFTQIPNEILEALYQTKLTIDEYRVLLLIIRKTYGWNKETDWIALSKFYEETGILKQNVSRALKKLERRNIIIRKSNHHIGIQKTCYAWRQEPKELCNTHRDII